MPETAEEIEEAALVKEEEKAIEELKKRVEALLHDPTAVSNFIAESKFNIKENPEQTKRHMVKVSNDLMAAMLLDRISDLGKYQKFAMAADEALLSAETSQISTSARMNPRRLEEMRNNASNYVKETLALLNRHAQDIEDSSRELTGEKADLLEVFRKKASDLEIDQLKGMIAILDRYAGEK